MSIESLSGAAGVSAYQSITPVKAVTAVEKVEINTNNAGAKTENIVPVSELSQNESDTLNGSNSSLDKNAKEQTAETAIKSASKDMNKMINKNTIAEFGYHEATHRITIKIKDRITNEVIKEIPSEKALEMLEKAWELAGIMVDEKR